jgi:cytochrome c556
MRQLFWISLLLIATPLAAQERRSPPPKFSPDQLQGIFFDKLSDAIRGQRPTLWSLRNANSPATGTTTANSGDSNRDQPSVGGDRWTGLIEPGSIEDEVKKVKLHFDSVVTTPSAFNSGGYQEARLDLTVLATLFAVIHEHGGEIRWKKQAASARDSLARTAFNCKAGSTQVYNEAKLRKGDLQDLVSGSGLSAQDGETASDWSKIADRAPLMQYAESLIEALEDATNDAASAKQEVDLIRRNAELIAVLGEALSQDGMDDADDEDYAKLSRAMSGSATDLVTAIETAELKEIQSAVGAIRRRCDACHEQYR